MTALPKGLVAGLALLLYASAVHAAVVIQYHHVDTATPAATSVSPDIFSEQMAYLASHGFAVWPLPRLLKALQAGEGLPDKVIAITFDDGYRSVYSNALPVLQHHHFPFTVFINTDLVGHTGFMNWAQLQELAAQGNTIANHSASHPHLVRQRDNESDTDWERRIKNEMLKAEHVIRQKLGDTPGLLAYPYGEYNRRVQALARETGLLAFAQHSGAFDQGVDWQAIPRFAFGGQYTDLKSFIEKVNSLPMPLVSVTVTNEAGQPLAEPLLPADVTRPRLELQLRTPALAKRVHCFASGQGRLAVEVNGTSITTQPGSALPVGRSRINCTAPSGQAGRYYWYSAFFMRKDAQGNWYKEY